MWIKGEPDCDSGWLPEHLYPLSEWHVIMGLLWKQFKAKQISREDMNQLEESMGILNYK